MAERLTVLLAVITFRRPAALGRLLASIRGISPVPGLAFGVHVVDNAPEGRALAQIAALAPGFPLPLSVAHAPTPGLGQARNAALQTALDRGVSHMGFVDDDEQVCPGWLRAHVAAIQSAAGLAPVASQGAVLARLPPGAPRWMRTGRTHEMPRHPDHAPLADAATNNVVFDLAPVRRHGLRFDPAFDRTGGEDTAFFTAYRRAGGRIVYAAGAEVVEDVPADRARLGWLWRRWRRTGQTSARIGPPPAPGPLLAAGAARLCAGGALAAAGMPFLAAGQGWPGVAGLRMAARGLGFVDTARGRAFEDYGQPAKGPQ